MLLLLDARIFAIFAVVTLVPFAFVALSMKLADSFAPFFKAASALFGSFTVSVDATFAFREVLTVGSETDLAFPFFCFLPLPFFGVTVELTRFHGHGSLGQLSLHLDKESLKLR